MASHLYMNAARFDELFREDFIAQAGRENLDLIAPTFLRLLPCFATAAAAVVWLICLCARALCSRLMCVRVILALRVRARGAQYCGLRATRRDHGFRSLLHYPLPPWTVTIAVINTILTTAGVQVIE